MRIDNANVAADGFYTGIKIVVPYMKTCWDDLVYPVFPKAETFHRDMHLKLLYTRAGAWMNSLQKLNHAVDSQAIIAGSRGLFEITVDMILLHHDKTNLAGWKMYWWGLSEKLKGAEEIISFYEKANQTLPDQHEPIYQFHKDQKAEIERMRKTLWPRNDPSKAVHPRRWTDRDLIEDIREADRLHQNSIQEELGMSLQEIYNTEFRRMSWFVHSGTPMAWELPREFYDLVCGVAFKRSADLGILCTKVILTDFGLTDHIPNLQEKWDEIKLLRYHNVKVRVEGSSDEIQPDRG